jgi:UTP--glucose-1-phosphate uridylyltransferase
MHGMTAVIPAAGLGTRLFPLAYAIPKELLPLGPRPTIQLVVEELLAADVQDFVVVIGKGKEAIPEHFAVLRERDPAFAADRLQLRFVVQEQPRGLGDAILSVADAVAGDFFVALGDAVIWGSRFGDLARRLLAVHQATGAAVVVAAQQVALQDTSRYGIIRPGEAGSGGAVRVLDLVEKPGPEHAPSRLAICARYVLSQEVFAVLRSLPPGHGGELQLTDALRLLAQENLAYAVPLEADEERWDVGSLEGYGRATVKAWQAQTGM